MLYNLSYYYDKARECGIADLNCRINACIRNPITGQTKYWPEVKTHYQYIDKCYSIAAEIPFEQLKSEYYGARFHSVKALEQVHIKVVEALNTLNDRDLNHMMGYTPISHMREQLLALSQQISRDLRNFMHTASPATPRVPPARKRFLARLFG